MMREFCLSLCGTWLGTLVYLLGNAMPVQAQADPSEVWFYRRPWPTSSDLLDVTYGNGAYVASGMNGTVLISRDAATWGRPRVDTFNQINGVAYGANCFVAVGGDLGIYRFTNGSDWQR